MKVIEERPFSFEFECSGCGSRLEAEAGDVRVGYFGANYGGDTPDRKYYVTCVVCGTNQVLEHTQVTPKVKQMADNLERRDLD